MEKLHFQNNAEIRKAMKERHLPTWRLADELGCHENTVYRMLRHEIVGEEKEKLLSIIKRIGQGGEHGNII